MKILSKFLKFLKTLLSFIISAIAVYFVLALVLSLFKTHPQKQLCSPIHETFVSTNGVHLDIVLHIENIDEEFLYNLEVLPGTNYVSFGWGDKDFYINTPEWSDLTFKTAFKALFIKSETAMHVTCYKNKYESWKPLLLCTSQLNSINNYIEKSFLINETKTFVKINVEGYNNYDSFFEAKGSFSFFKTCNIWVNKALKEAEIKTSVWSPFDFGVLFHISN